MKKPKIVVIGGGTGSYIVLSGLKKYPFSISAVVAMTDSGGSTGKLRDQLGVLPPGDLRQALVALSESHEIWRDLFVYRFDSGDFVGHNFGNVFISALEKITGSNEKALYYATKILKTKGNVIPVTFSNSTLCAEYEDGSLVRGEYRIDESYTKRPKIVNMYLAPKAVLNPKAKEAIKNADFIIFPPGDLYTSIVPNLLVTGCAKAICTSKAKKIYIANLMTKLGQTDDFTINDFITELDKYIGGNFLNYVVVNNKPLDKDVVRWYKKADNTTPVVDNISKKNIKGKTIVHADLISPTKYEQSVEDRVKRSLLRHDPDKVGSVLFNIVMGNTSSVADKK